VLAYMTSCVRETIIGGTVVVGTDSSQGRRRQHRADPPRLRRRQDAAHPPTGRTLSPGMFSATARKRAARRPQGSGASRACTSLESDRLEEGEDGSARGTGRGSGNEHGDVLIAALMSDGSFTPEQRIQVVQQSGMYP
jgi:hypothetical protein